MFRNTNTRGIIYRRKSSSRPLKFTREKTKYNTIVRSLGRLNLWRKTEYKTIVHSLPEQVIPSPEYPSRQVQVKLQGVLVHFARELQFPLFWAHSSTSVTTQEKQNKASAQINQNRHMHKKRKKVGGIVAQLTNTCRPVGCRAVGLSPSWLATRYFHKRNIGYICRYYIFVAISLYIIDVNRRHISCQPCCAVIIPIDLKSRENF